jgi:hypothetical protein
MHHQIAPAKLKKVAAIPGSIVKNGHFSAIQRSPPHGLEHL